MGYLRFFALLAVVGMACDSRAQGTKEVWLDELDLSFCIQDWGLPQADRSVLDTPLTVGGVVYGRGVGTHSISRMLFGLGGDAVSMTGAVGADDKNLFAGKHRFKILGDRKVLWDSGVMRKGDAARAVDVDLSGLDKVLLLVEEAGDGIMYDHADWLEVKITTRGEVEPLPVWARPISKGKYILTPASPETPQINNPLVYGARPGNPFLMPVMASGKRPMAYGAQGLPEGLELDTRTGLITGRVPAEGDFRVLLTAENALGKAEREILLKIGPQIALTPPMGWNSWNCWGFSVDDAKVRDAARAMHEKLLAYGWTYVNIDDGWPADTRSADGRLLPNEKFPDFKGLSDYVHSLGLKFGIYSSPGPTTCGNYPGSYRHELTDARTWAEWGVDYLKHDYCGYLQIERDSEEKTIQEPYVVMRKALDQVDRDIVYCVGYGAPNVWNWGAEAGGNLWRTTRDITDEWNVVTAIGCFQDVCAQATAPGRYNDPDMLVVGRLGCRCPRIRADPRRTICPYFAVGHPLRPAADRLRHAGDRRLHARAADQFRSDRREPGSAGRPRRQTGRSQRAGVVQKTLRRFVCAGIFPVGSLFRAVGSGRGGSHPGAELRIRIRPAGARDRRKGRSPGLVAAARPGYMHGHAPGAGTLPRGFAGQDNARGMSSGRKV